MTPAQEIQVKINAAVLKKQKDDDLRDHFAGLALQTIWKYYIEESLGHSEIAPIAYNIAEAMMEERERRLGK
jgi:hypothetical protein